jgi:hypothetical protein
MKVAGKCSDWLLAGREVFDFEKGKDCCLGQHVQSNLEAHSVLHFVTTGKTAERVTGC